MQERRTRPSNTPRQQSTIYCIKFTGIFKTRFAIWLSSARVTPGITLHHGVFQYKKLTLVSNPLLQYSRRKWKNWQTESKRKWRHHRWRSRRWRPGRKYKLQADGRSQSESRKMRILKKRNWILIRRRQNLNFKVRCPSIHCITDSQPMKKINTKTFNFSSVL